MTHPIEPPVFGPDTTIDDIDLTEEEFILPDGRRLTDELADKITAHALQVTVDEVRSWRET